MLRRCIQWPVGDALVLRGVGADPAQVDERVFMI